MEQIEKTTETLREDYLLNKKIFNIQAIFYLLIFKRLRYFVPIVGSKTAKFSNLGRIWTRCIAKLPTKWRCDSVCSTNLIGETNDRFTIYPVCF